jgi:hypothetical protein
MVKKVVVVDLSEARERADSAREVIENVYVDADARRYVPPGSALLLPDEIAALAEAERERDEAKDSLAMLCSAWNEHFARCTMPLPHGVTWEQLREWENAPSNTAGAGGET